MLNENGVGWWGEMHHKEGRRRALQFLPFQDVSCTNAFRTTVFNLFSSTAVQKTEKTQAKGSSLEVALEVENYQLEAPPLP